MVEMARADVNEILGLLSSQVTGILQEQFVGMYLFGSLANGGFDQHSDIDVLVVTHSDISQKTFELLKEMHVQLMEFESPWSDQLEVSYIPQAALRRFDPANKIHPHLDRGRGERLHYMAHESDWIIQRHILRERGVVISGPGLQSLIDPVLPHELRQAVADVLPFWADPILANPSLIRKRGYQSFFVLSICRMLYTLKHGAILSKQDAAEWGKANLPARWRALNERALWGRQHPDQEAEQEDIQGTLQMLKYVVAQTKPTPYAEVNEVLHLLLSNVKGILEDQFVGMYLYGSLSSGDFDPHTSDIDFLVVTDNVLPPEMIASLEAMHKEAWAGSLKRAGKLEGAYVPRALIRCHDPAGPACPTVNEGRFYVAPLGSDWIIQRHVVREYGVVLEGPDPKTLIDFVCPEEIRGAVRAILEEWWFPMLDNPAWLQNHERGYRAFAVITMCRVLHALEHGTIISKPGAVRWARARLDGRWQQLIDLACAVPQHTEEEISLAETLDFIAWIRQKVKS